MATPQVESIENYPLLSEEDENEFVCKPQASEDATAPIGCNSEIVGSDEEDGNNLKCVTDHFPANRNVPRNAKYLLEVVIRSWFLKEAVMLLKLALPLFLMNAFTQLPFFVTLLFVGHFSGKIELDATLLGSTFLNITGTSLLVGMATAADTLCPQSYGYKNYKRVGVILQRGLLILSVACVPVVVIWLNSESLLLLVQQDPCVVSLTGRYASIFTLALPGLLTYFMLGKYLQAQSLVVVFVGIGLASNVCLVIFCAVFVAGMHLGSIGASISLVMVTILSPVLLFAYIKWRKLHTQTWGGWSFECLTEWWQFLRLGVPGIFSLAFEWWSFEITTLVAGSISTTELTISSTILQLATIFYMAPLGMAQAVTVRVGNELGAGHATSAKRASFVALGLQTVFATVLSVVTIACRNYIGFIFITDPEVVAGVGDTLTTAIGIIFLDQIQGVISGIMRATGRQGILAVINFCCYYIVGLPLGITLALVLDMKSKGIWLGLSVADFIQTTILIVLLFKTNWRKECEKAMKNANAGSEYTEVMTANKSRSPSVVSRDSGIEGAHDRASLDPTDDIMMQELYNDGVEREEIKNNVAVTLVRFTRGTTREDILLPQSECEECEEELLPFEQRSSVGEIEEAVDDERRESGVDVSCDHTSRLIHLDSEEDLDRGRKGSVATEEGFVLASRRLYNTSTKFCQTKLSIFISKGIVLLVCVGVLVGGAVLAATIRHHPKGCGLTESQNCSLACLNSSLEVGSAFGATSPPSPTESLDQPTRISPSVVMIMPHPSPVLNSDDVLSSDCLCELMPTPSPLFS